ncbi:uncharacterized protein LOC114560745 [Perca flavescens]|uniref:uncharacterized protein LOC114560745 n=1 Tax=Perca flavescens TaxID=8167 RepID=UPI00106E5109|nr:uncharacterized protein LOC114560745 [Perca flavescens]
MLKHYLSVEVLERNTRANAKTALLLPANPKQTRAISEPAVYNPLIAISVSRISGLVVSINSLLLHVDAVVELTSMAFPIGVSWLCTLLLWGCICFPPEKGHIVAHGYFFNDGEFRSHAGVLGPQTSNLFHSGPSLNKNQDSVSPRDEMQAMRDQSFVSLQREPVHENNEDASSVTSLSEKMVQRKPDSVPSGPTVQKYEREGSDSQQHPFGLLVKPHTQERTVEGTSFQTIKDFNRFIETMKNSFLMPGNDFGRHFQTARKTMANKMASNAENVKGEPDTGSRFLLTKERAAHDGASENEVWIEPMNTAFEPSKQGANYPMPSENLPIPDPVDSTASLISTNVYDNQDSGPGSALYPHHHLAATEHVSSYYGSYDRGGISGGNPDTFTSAPHERNENVVLSYKLPERIPSGSFFGEDLSFSGHVTVPPVNPLNSPSQDFSDYLSKKSNVTPRTSGKKQPKYKSHKVTPADVLSAPMPPSSNSYGKSLYVGAPRDQLFFPDYLPKHREKTAQSFQAYQPTVGKESKDISYTPTTHLSVSTSSVSSSSDYSSPRSSSSHVGVQTSSPHDSQNQAFHRKQPVRFHPMFSVKPSSSLHGSSRHDCYLGDQTVSIQRPYTLTAKAKDEEKSDLSKLNLVSQGPKQIADRNPLSSFTTSLRRGISLNGGRESVTRAGLLQTIIQPTKAWKHPANMNKEPGNVAYWPLKPLSASKGSASTLSGVFRRNGGNTKKLPPQTGSNMSPPSVNTYVDKSRNSYVLRKVSLSKTRYAPLSAG